MAACAGFNNTGLAVIEMAGKKVVQFIPEPRLWNGLAFSGDGRRVFVSGGNPARFSSLLIRMAGLRQARQSSRPPRRSNPGGHRRTSPHRQPVRGQRGQSRSLGGGSQESGPRGGDPRRAAPHSCVFGADGIHLYVSNWGGRSVSIIDTAAGKPPPRQAVGIRPNDMAVCARRAAVRGLRGRQHGPRHPTQSLEKVEPGASPAAASAGRTREIFATSLYPSSPEGSTP